MNGLLNQTLARCYKIFTVDLLTGFSPLCSQLNIHVYIFIFFSFINVNKKPTILRKKAYKNFYDVLNANIPFFVNNYEIIKDSKMEEYQSNHCL